MYYVPNFNKSAEIQKVKDNRVKRRHQAARKARSTSTRIEELEDEVMFLNLVNRTMISLMTDRGLITQEEFIKRLAQLDEEDGVIDGGSTGDDLAQEIGFEDLPVDREKEGPQAPTPSKNRRRD
ncbi:MAG: hypothetical protein ACI97A_003398 [Planctomycetota bacterium]|jgi:hypothetical protein